MLKAPIILPIVPSKYWLLGQCCLLVGIAALSYWVGGGLALILAVVVGSGIACRAYAREPKGVLYLTATAPPFHGRWLLGDQLEKSDPELNKVLSEEQQVRCDYLGPWLIGLYVGKQRVWLWPDSAPAESLREVRRLFHHPGR
ncbi:hypothetical protein [Halovibrio sp. HP20-59]|uniref:hypothetical protein n=1 Tax=Halovibrio sp. HP20-59 TaxID=3080275 RepID=UPI002AFF8363|nr:hypothetical protein [Halovibrio sp. HP20-59]MEA2119386.1 hypothetical protein [Halovibrio sp. HP20-59]